jgi:hypothetical protein
VRPPNGLPRAGPSKRSTRPGVSPGFQLQPAEAATTVRVQDGRTLTTDGPCVAVTEALAGYLYFEAEDLEAAIEPGGADSARRVSEAVEVRPVMVTVDPRAGLRRRVGPDPSRA